ncbi:hypothetical protein DL93DRAFT_2163242 [Clavulina sp. PMI_390]|nr:hypothetical protein DL93DRAFT_2163242 [Clavulina sp. PMI_390]
MNFDAILNKNNDENSKSCIENTLSTQSLTAVAQDASSTSSSSTIRRLELPPPIPYSPVTAHQSARADYNSHSVPGLASPFHTPAPSTTIQSNTAQWSTGNNATPAPAPRPPHPRPPAHSTSPPPPPPSHPYPHPHPQDPNITSPPLPRKRKTGPDPQSGLDSSSIAADDQEDPNQEDDDDGKEEAKNSMRSPTPVYAVRQEK